GLDREAQLGRHRSLPALDQIAAPVEQQLRGEAQRLPAGRQQLDQGREPMQRLAAALDRPVVATERATDQLARLRVLEPADLADLVEPDQRPGGRDDRRPLALLVRLFELGARRRSLKAPAQGEHGNRWQRSPHRSTIAPPMPWNRDQIAARAARELPGDSVVNLGIGIPTLISNYLRPEQNIFLHSENGLLGMGPFPLDHEVDPQIINAGKQT